MVISVQINRKCLIDLVIIDCALYAILTKTLIKK